MLKLWLSVNFSYFQQQEVREVGEALAFWLRRKMIRIMKMLMKIEKN